MYVVLPYWFQMLYFHHLMCPSVWLLIQLPQWGGGGIEVGNLKMICWEST